jgi:hypothetical protein
MEILGKFSKNLAKTILIYTTKTKSFPNMGPKNTLITNVIKHIWNIYNKKKN